MYLYSIMPLDVEHADEICQDIKEQYEGGVATCALFKMTLVPEGCPPIDKAKIMAEKYDVFKGKLDAMGLKSGILVQASIGHGYSLNSMFPFQRYVNLTSGREESVCCPYDDGFREHFRGVMRTLAEHKPAEIMVDDDFRLIFRGGKGCACPLHLAEFNRRAGTGITREQLLLHTEGTSAEDMRLTNIFIETQRESMLLAAKAMRQGIDDVDPKLPCTFCACGPAAEFAAEVADILAGEGNPAIVRINNGMYSNPGSRGLSDASFRSATQIAVLKNEAKNRGIKLDAILAETDTCPQNRYSTSAQFVHAHFTATILEGATGAKHWITRLESHEPKSGKAYRRVLSKNRGFYDELSKIAPTVKWQGCRFPMSTHPSYGYASCPIAKEDGGWQYCVLERLGLPMYFSAESGGAVFMDGTADMKFTDDELREMFKGTVVLAGETAERINSRGFGECTGVRVSPWGGKHISGERLFVNGNSVQSQKASHRLSPIGDKADTEELSVVFHVPDGKTEIPLFPGVVRYKNHLGGTSVIFSGRPKAELIHTEGFSFLNESRKLQLISILKDADCLPVYYPGDAEMYLRAGNLPDGGMIVVAFNLGFDSMDEFPLVFDEKLPAVKTVARLMPDGTRKACEFSKDFDCDGNEARSGEIFVKTPVTTLEPVVLFIDAK